MHIPPCCPSSGMLPTSSDKESLLPLATFGAALLAMGYAVYTRGRPRSVSMLSSLALTAASIALYLRDPLPPPPHLDPEVEVVRATIEDPARQELLISLLQERRAELSARAGKLAALDLRLLILPQSGDVRSDSQWANPIRNRDEIPDLVQHISLLVATDLPRHLWIDAQVAEIGYQYKRAGLDCIRDLYLLPVDPEPIDTPHTELPVLLREVVLATWRLEHVEDRFLVWHQLVDAASQGLEALHRCVVSLHSEM